MRGHIRIVAALSAWAWIGTGDRLLAEPQVIEIGPKNTDVLPGGREADGIIGDFVLRNDRIEAVISGNQHNRKANMAVKWGAPTGGTLYDLTPRGANNDQLTWFGPGDQEGLLSDVTIVEDVADGEAIVQARLSLAAGSGFAKTHEYILKDGWRHVLVISTYENRREQAVEFQPGGAWMGLTFEFQVDGITVGSCEDPADKIGYAFAGVRDRGAMPAADQVDVRPGDMLRFAGAIPVGRGTAEAYGIIASLRGPTSHFQGRVVGADGAPVTTATVHFPTGQPVAAGAPAGSQKEKTLVAFLDDDGRFDLNLPDKSYRVTVKDLGRPDVEADLIGGSESTIRMEAASGVDVVVTDAAGGPLPCKVQFIGIEGTETPYLGPIIRAHGCDNQYHSETGQFRQTLPPGKYRVVVTRGIEYDHADKTIDVPKGEFVRVEVSLRRIVETPGWVSTDFHNHTTVSGDNYCGTDDRIINLAAEHVEFAPATEHNRIYDWQPHVDKLGLGERVATVTGMELTGGGPHLNAFPLKVEPYRQDNGAPEWNPDPRISALRLRQHPGDLASRWVHLNHPDIAKFFNDWNNDKKADGGFTHLAAFIDASEMWSPGILAGTPRYVVEWQGKTYDRENWAFAWLQMLNAGETVWTIAVSDAHQVTQGGVGGWRTYVRSSHDEPASIDPAEVIAHAKAGHSFVTCGPFLEVETADGHGPGETVTSSGGVTLNVRVQCNTWTDVDRVAVLVNGRVEPSLDFKRSEKPELFSTGVVGFDRDIEVKLDADAHLIVAAAGEEKTLETGYGRSPQSRWHPVAYHNPIFVDVDGDGFHPNGDTLGHPYLQFGRP